MIQAIQNGWLENTAYPQLNVAIGCTKLLSSMALTLLAIQKFPKLSLVSGVALSGFETIDILFLDTDNRNAQALATDSITGRARLRAAQRGIQLIMITYLLKKAGSTIYLRHTTLRIGSLKILGSLGGAAVSGFAACSLLDVLVNRENYTFSEGAGLWFGVWHPLP